MFLLLNIDNIDNVCLLLCISGQNGEVFLLRNGFGGFCALIFIELCSYCGFILLEMHLATNENAAGY